MSQFIVLKDCNNHQSPFKIDEFMSQLVDNQQPLFGCDLAFLLTMKQAAEGLGIPQTPQGAQQWFEHMSGLIEVIRGAGIELTPQALGEALAKPDPKDTGKKPN